MNAAMMLLCLAGGAPLAQPDVVFKAPHIEVRTGSRHGKPHSYLMYNRTYLGHQYRPSKDRPDLHRLPTAYYHDQGPVGIVLRDPKRFPAKAEPPIAVLGMDIGIIAAYGQPGQTMHFTERVPAFVKLSFPDKGQKRHFSFMQDAIERGVKVKLFEGEPRATFEKHAAAGFYQAIVIDIHKLPDATLHKDLMTREALQMLMAKTREDGIICFHTSNRYYDIPPIIFSACNALGFACVVGSDHRWVEVEDHRFGSEWVMVARNQKHLAHLKTDERQHERVTWLPSQTYGFYRDGRFNELKIDKQFLWTDSSEQSYRGLYRLDPNIEQLRNVVDDVTDFAHEKVGVPGRYVIPASRPLYHLIRAFSTQSAANLNRDPAPTQPKGERK